MKDFTAKGREIVSRETSERVEKANSTGATFHPCRAARIMRALKVAT
jgi:hypothetical protein